MKKYISSHYLILFLSFLVVVSCDDDIVESTFDSPPALRAQESVDELRALLIARPNGFKATYFTKNDERGGFTFYMQFNEDGSVRQTSDILNGDFDIRTSSYDVRFNVTTELVFTSRNHITEASSPVAEDPDGEPVETGTGYAGTNNFQFFKVDDEGVLYFRDVRNRNTASLKLTPTNFTDFDAQSISSVQQSYQRRLDFDDCTAGIFSFMQVTSSSGVINYDLNYNGSTLYAEPGFFEEDGSLSEFDMGILFTEDSVIISPALEVDGEVLEEFFLDTSSEVLQYTAVQNGVTAIIGYSTTPVRPILGYQELSDFLILHNPFLNSLGTSDFLPDLTNQCFVDLITDLNASIPFMDVTRIDLYDLETESATLLIGTSIGNAFYSISKEIIDDKVYLAITATGVPQWFTDAVQPLLDVIVDPEGLYVDQPTTLNRFTNLVFTFTPASNTSIKYSAVAF